MALDSVEVWVMKRIVEADTAGISDEAVRSQLGISGNHFGEMIEKLLKQGYIKVLIDNEDPRARSYRPTPKATMHEGA